MTSTPHTSTTMTYSFRLRPRQDLKKELAFYCQQHRLHAATILSAVGSLSHARLRLANSKEGKDFSGPFEILSLNGTLSLEGVHLHVAISDSEGQVIGGHLLDGCEIYTTAEIVLLENKDLVFERQQDGHTGYKELFIKNK